MPSDYGPHKTDLYDTTEILLKVALNTIYPFWGWLYNTLGEFVCFSTICSICAVLDQIHKNNWIWSFIFINVPS